MTKTFATAAAAFTLLVSPMAFAQTAPGSSGSSPQAGVGGPADGAKGGTNSMAKRSMGAGPTVAPGTMGTAKSTKTGGASGGPDQP